MEDTLSGRFTAALEASKRDVRWVGEGIGWLVAWAVILPYRALLHGIYAIALTLARMSSRRAKRWALYLMTTQMMWATHFLPADDPRRLACQRAWKTARNTTISGDARARLVYSTVKRGFEQQEVA